MTTRPRIRVVGRILALLNDRERKQVPLLIAASTIMALLEVVGIASIMPFLGAMAGNEIPEPLARILDDVFGVTSARGTVMVLAGAVLFLVITRNAFSALTMWALLRWTSMRAHSLSVRLLNQYVYQPYSYYLNRNTSELGTAILSEVSTFTSNVLFPCLQMTAQAISALAIVSLLVVVNPVLAVLVTAVLGLGYVAVYALSRSRLLHLGKLRSVANARRFRFAREALGGIKEIAVLNRQDFFVRRFANESETVAKTSASSQTMAELPRFALEALAFGGLVIVVLYLVAVEGTLGGALPLIGLYAVAGFRLLPALQQLFSSISRLRFGLSALDVIERDLQETSEFLVPSSEQEVILPIERISVRDLSYVYPSETDVSLDGVTFDIPVRNWVAIVGTTGSGKSTLLHLIAGLLRPASGTVQIDDRPLSRQNTHGWQMAVGFVPQQIFLHDDTVAANIALGVPESEMDHERIEYAASIALVHDFVVSDLPLGYDTHIGEAGLRLSGGQRQRLGIARALYTDPQVLLLDEATSALDQLTEKSLLEGLRSIEPGVTLVTVAHRLASIRTADQIVLLERGRIVDQGAFHELVARNVGFREMVGPG